MKDFHVILPSNTPGNDNVANHFITQCNQHINLEGEWRVGLSEISFYKNSITCPKGSGYEQHVQGTFMTTYNLYTELTGDDFDADYFVLPANGDWNVETNNYDRLGTVIGRGFRDIKNLNKIVVFIDEETEGKTYYIKYDEINNSLYVNTTLLKVESYEKLGSNGSELNEHVSELNRDRVTGTYSTANKVFQKVFPLLVVPNTVKKVRVDDYYYVDQKITIQLGENKSFANIKQLLKELNTLSTKSKNTMLSQTNLGSFIYENERVKCEQSSQVKFLGGLQFVLGYEKSTIGNNEIAPFPPQLHRGIGSLYVYSNICDNTQIGNVQVPLLRQIVLPPPDKERKVSGMIEKITFDSPMYVPVRITTINSIEIEIRTNTGDYFPFVEDSVTTVTLHFKKYE